MRVVFRNATTDGTSSVQVRSAKGLASFLVDGVLKVRETSGGGGAAATVTWRDEFTNEVIDTIAITSGAGQSGVLAKVPYSYTLEISGITGGAIIDAGIDGDVGLA